MDLTPVVRVSKAVAEVPNLGLLLMIDFKEESHTSFRKSMKCLQMMPLVRLAPRVLGGFDTTSTRVSKAVAEVPKE